MLIIFSILANLSLAQVSYHRMSERLVSEIHSLSQTKFIKDELYSKLYRTMDDECYEMANQLSNNLGDKITFDFNENRIEYKTLKSNNGYKTSIEMNAICTIEYL
jgi:adenine C2-methylase RlmN of 23S rRNA A2503 and tRNA A37